MAFSHAPMLTARDQEILLTLSLKARLMSLGQIACAWFSGAESVALAALTKLSKGSFVSICKVACHPLLPLNRPVVTWQPGEPPPEIGATSTRLRSRWNRALSSTTVVCAAPRAAALFGTRVRPISAVQATHDVHVAALYLKQLHLDPAKAARWVGESTNARPPSITKVPDAVIEDEEGSWELVIEFGGSYPPERVERIHETWAKANLPYEIW